MGEEQLIDVFKTVGQVIGFRYLFMTSVLGIIYSMWSVETCI